MGPRLRFAAAFAVPSLLAACGSSSQDSGGSGAAGSAGTPAGGASGAGAGGASADGSAAGGADAGSESGVGGASATDAASDAGPSVVTASWTRTITAFDASVSALAASGDLTIVGGTYSGKVDFGFGEKFLSSSLLVVTAYDKAGQPVWAREFPGSGVTLAATPNRIALVTQFSGTAKFGAFELESAPGSYAVAVVGLDTAGNVKWARAFDVADNWNVGSEELRAAVDTSGAVYFTSPHEAPVNVGTIALTGSGELIAKLTPDGATVAWVLDSKNPVVGMGTDAADHLVVAVQNLHPGSDFGGAVPSCTGGGFACLGLARLKPDGKRDWWVEAAVSGNNAELAIDATPRTWSQYGLGAQLIGWDSTGLQQWARPLHCELLGAGGGRTFVAVRSSGPWPIDFGGGAVPLPPAGQTGWYGAAIGPGDAIAWSGRFALSTGSVSMLGPVRLASGPFVFAGATEGTLTTDKTYAAATAGDLGFVFAVSP